MPTLPLSGKSVGYSLDAVISYRKQRKEDLKMLTFENVLSGFKDYLAEDTLYEVVMTSHGYTVMEWDEKALDWDCAHICQTPEDLKEFLLKAYAGHLVYKATLCRREPTAEERQEISFQVDIMNRRIQ